MDVEPKGVEADLGVEAFSTLSIYQPILRRKTMPTFIIDMPGKKPVDITKAIKTDGVEKAITNAIKISLTKKDAGK